MRIDLPGFTVALIFLMLQVGVSRGEQQEIAVPEAKWKIEFDSPPLKPIDEKDKNAVYFGRSEEFVVSFYAEAPRCAGGDTNEVIYYCFQSYIKDSPFVIWDTERGNSVSNGVLVTYLGQRPSNKGVPVNINMHLLFAHNGKWADFHISYTIKSADQEINGKAMETMQRVINSIRVVDEGV